MRYRSLDRLRGVTVASMILYHAVWDLVYIFHMEWKWYESLLGHVWQQSICWTFIFLSGFCWQLGRKRMKRGLLVFGMGLLIMGATMFLAPGQRIVFGVLTCIGSCMLLLIPLEKLLAKIPAPAGIWGSFLLFILFHGVSSGFLGFGALSLLQMPAFLYRDYATAYLGFPKPDFYSADYFPLLPWLFLFLAGFFCFRFLKETDRLKWLEAPWHLTGKKRGGRFGAFLRLPEQGLAWAGRHALLIYMLHQPLLYAILKLWKTLAFLDML